MNIQTANKDEMMTEVLFNEELFNFVGGDEAADMLTDEELRRKLKEFILSSPEA